MKKQFGFLIFVAVCATSVFAQNQVEENNYRTFSHYLGPSLGVGAMKMNDGAIFTFDVGASYDFYIFEWLAISGGIIAHQELYYNQPSDDTRMVPVGNPFCITVPFGLHFKIPKIEWLYNGFNFALNFPMFDSSSPKNAYSTENEMFFSVPLDLGFDFMKPGKGGSRAFVRVTPTFHKGGVAVPVGFVWQIHNWKIGSSKAETYVAPQPTTIIIIN